MMRYFLSCGASTFIYSSSLLIERRRFQIIVHHLFWLSWLVCIMHYEVESCMYTHVNIIVRSRKREREKKYPYRMDVSAVRGRIAICHVWFAPIKNRRSPSLFESHTVSITHGSRDTCTVSSELTKQVTAEILFISESVTPRFSTHSHQPTDCVTRPRWELIWHESHSHRFQQIEIFLRFRTICFQD